MFITWAAEFLGLPYVPPYFGSKSVSFDQGVNFAVYGATALDRALLVEKGIKSDFTNVSLSVSSRGEKCSLVIYRIYDDN